MAALAARGPQIKPLIEMTATEIVAAIGEGRTTCEAVVRACLDRIAARETEVHAWAHIDPTPAGRRARLRHNRKRGPLAGVPFGVKDIIDTIDMPTEWGTPIHNGRRPERDAACVALSRKAGGILLGKTVTTEFANLHPGPTRNPHDLTRTPLDRPAAPPPLWPISWCRSRSAPRPPARRSARPRSAACSATARPMASTACTASWRRRVDRYARHPRAQHRSCRSLP